MRSPQSSSRTFGPRTVLVRAALAGGAVASCVDGPGADGTLPAADYDAFVENVQPVLGLRCAQRSCHGVEDRPLEIFAAGEHRAPGVEDDGLLTDAELEANFNRARDHLVDVDDAADSPLVTKPLAVDAGGILHATGPVFLSTEDDEYLVLLEWVEDALAMQE